jgi:hypothetical protein
LKSLESCRKMQASRLRRHYLVPCLSLLKAPTEIASWKLCCHHTMRKVHSFCRHCEQNQLMHVVSLFLTQIFESVVEFSRTFL